MICINQDIRYADQELGASAYRKYDIEVWMPGRDGWGEVTARWRVRSLCVKFCEASILISALDFIGI